MPLWTPLIAGCLDLIAPLRCPGCDVEHPWGAKGFCPACTVLLERLPHGPATFAYGGPMAVALRALKFEGRVDYVKPLAALWVSDAWRHAGKVDVIIPVPLHRAKRRARGFNQTSLLAAPLVDALGVPMDVARVRRVRDTPAQASLRRDQRGDNVRGAFEATRDDSRRRVLLVDDVRTTGATLQAAAGALYRSGASAVRICALAGVE